MWILDLEKLLIFLLAFFLPEVCISQTAFNGIVKDTKNEPIFAANVYFKSDIEKGTATDFEGQFSLMITNWDDSLIISHIGYKTKIIPILSMKINQENVIILEKDNNVELNEVVVSVQTPISMRYSMSKIEKYDIYLNPASEGDPLKAVSFLPSSTITDETASPSLRGSSANRSIVAINGIPIHNPAKTNQLNSNGFFSIFNPELINSMYVHAGNPPLTYGNSTAGLVEIQTTKNVEYDQFQFTGGLGGIGAFLSKNIKKDVAFIQVYGNYQFSDLLMNTQKTQFPEMKIFLGNDLGVNYSTRIKENIVFNSYNYYSKDKYEGIWNYLASENNIDVKNKRFFSVNNIKFYHKKGVLSFNNGLDFSNPYFKYGNIKSDGKLSNLYFSLNNKLLISRKLNIETGINYTYNDIVYDDSIPVYYYALSLNSPREKSFIDMTNHILEAYLYSNTNMNNSLSISFGIRSNLPIKEQKNYISSQLGLRYDIDAKHSILFGIGKYHSYSIPNTFSSNFILLSSSQLSVDYIYKNDKVTIGSAIYAKKEMGPVPITFYSDTNPINTKTIGFELSVEYNFNKYLKSYISNSFVNQIVEINKVNYNGSKNLNYFTKLSIIYNNPRVFSISVNYIGYPGRYYNAVINSIFDNNTNNFMPIFEKKGINYAQYSCYNRLDLSVNKMVNWKAHAFIFFASIYNIFDWKNEKDDIYNLDYSVKKFTYYQKRMAYLGFVWHFSL
jgi:hypothetical protein